jgi:surfeit locus 1 family protein
MAAVLGVLLTALLGNWQLNRAAEKAQLQERIEQAGRLAPIHLGAAQVDPAGVVYFRVEANGEFKRDATVYVDNRVRDGIAGYEIVTPLRVEGSAHYVLVDRGWVQAGNSRSQLPEVTTPSGTVSVEGIALPGNPRVFELSNEVQAGRVWQNVTVDRYRKAFGLDLQPIVLHQQSDLADGLLREWKRPDVGIDRHRGYALQWFSMSLAIIALYVILNVKRASGSSRAA